VGGTVNEIDVASKKFQKELNAGTVALVLLRVLDRATAPIYGYQIAKQLGASGREVPMMKQGALYPVLRSLEGNGLLVSRVEPSVTGPPRRYYTITTAGRESLRRWTELWNTTKTFVDEMLKGTADEY
jgi:PadR family transcriptional regulator PadR